MAMIRLRDLHRTKVWLLQTAVISLVGMIWQIGTHFKVLDPFFFSSPWSIMIELRNFFIEGMIYKHLATTLEEMLIGLSGGIILGVLIGLILGIKESAARALDPLLMGIYAIPKIALSPLFILWFGLGMTSKIVFSGTVVFFIVFFNTYSGFRNVDQTLVRAVQAMGGRPLTILIKVHLPSCLPWVFTGIRTSISRALVGAIVGEFISSDQGLGWMILMAAGLFQTTRLMAVVVVLSMIVIVMDGIVRAVESRLLRWQPQVSRN